MAHFVGAMCALRRVHMYIVEPVSAMMAKGWNISNKQKLTVEKGERATIAKSHNFSLII